MIPNPPWPAREECARWSHVNLGDIESHPLLRDKLEDVLERFSRIVFSRIYPGAMTSGATESNLLALLYWRKKGKKRVLATPMSHYSIPKAASILGMEYREYNLDKIADKISSEDVVVVTLGKTETGFTDNMDVLYDIVRKRKSVMHVDAAYFGSIARFVLNRDIHLDEYIASLAVDLHKIPEAPPPAGVLFVYDEKALDDLWFKSEYIPSGRQFGVLGTRPGCSVFAADKALSIVIEGWSGGPAGLALDLIAMIDDIVASINDFGYESLGGPAPIRCIKHKNINKIKKYLKNNGFRVYSCLGNGIRIVAMPHNIWQGYKWVIDVLVSAVREG